MRRISLFILMTLLAMALALSACRRSEYYHPKWADAKRQGDYNACRAEADDKAEKGRFAQNSPDYNEYVRDCMERIGWTYQD